MLTLEDLNTLQQSAEPVSPSSEAGTKQIDRIASFERAAGPYRTLLRSARQLLVAGRSIGPELEKELRQGSRALWRTRQRLDVAARNR